MKLGTLMTAIMALLISMSAWAGFRAYDDDTLVGPGVDIKCAANLACTKVRGGFQIAVEQEQVAVGAAATLTAAQCGGTFINSGSFQVELPEASTVLGCRYTFVVGGSDSFQVNPDDADQILLETNAAGDAIHANAAGESIVIEAISASQWAPIGAAQGTWSDAN